MAIVNGNGVAVRRACVADADAVAPLFDAYRQFYRKPGDIGLARRFLRERLESGQSTVFLAVTANGSAAGFTQLYPSFSSVSAAPIFVLNDLYVEPSARRAGVASLLLAAATSFGREAGAVRLTLSTEVGNLAAQALYEREGWERQSDFFVYDFTPGA